MFKDSHRSKGQNVKGQVKGQKVKRLKSQRSNQKSKGQIKGQIKALKALECKFFHSPTVYTNQEINEYSYLNSCKYTLSTLWIII